MVNDPHWRLPDVPRFTLESADFVQNGPLPATARADGGGISPELHWSGAPDGTQSFVLTVYDPDAPTGSGFWHWAVRDIPAGTTELPAGAGTDGTLPDGAITSANEMRADEYAGAAPPPGHGAHRYFFTLSALDVATLDVPDGATPAVLGFVMRDNVIARATLVGTAETPAA
ncbi:YbhB/YbcL family Raf kinase inhibitor-like protein [Lacisediminihabitans changchengi]|uniref:YbhB/YbcL family Raf kinase inhibitor-like protein n=1 Tax=Lacisediminihabitans changchengi TaxID=2787634 RepID=A0A934SRA0_9MICO|nr:YbhB/YbcL family Raf kinase inhibitor-like protein [Lacisediminihabitans changchengi]MBK4347588.1 YbhB/YbcL family Raf kinase inhibitor-like protein [Lacisediminihabitans changchengi]